MAHPTPNRFATAAMPVNTSDLRHYFEYSAKGIEVVQDGLQEVSFGEFLIEHKILDRYQLFRALQMQDRQPGVRLGEAAAALGYVKIGEVEALYARFAQLSTVMVG
ncbi:MAG TPA: hypothetical protein PLF40_18045 [Kofleriaceae bacterium]|nr:hypothetical protein [Kofleriaceae bacterium]